jgi:hypothetical protein
MAVNVSNTKFIIFHTLGKHIDYIFKIFYDENEPDEQKPEVSKVG